MTSADIRDLLSEEERVALTREELLARRQRWSSVAWIFGGLALVSLIGAGIVLSRSGLGTAVVLRGCSWGFGAGLALILSAGGLLGLSHLALRMRRADRWTLSLNDALAYGGVPLVVALICVPAFIGCGFASRLSRLGLLGDAVVGAPGMAIAGASCFGVGYAMLAACRTYVDRKAEQ
jgi:hypothetical protein